MSRKPSGGGILTALVKPRKTTFKHIEAEWYNYHHTLQEIARLREEIINPFREVDENIGGGKSNITGDPTGRIATRLATSKQIQHLEEVVNAIEKVYNALPNDYKNLVRVRYWSNKKMSWDEIADEIHVHRTTAMRWRNEIIQATIELLGWR